MATITSAASGDWSVGATWVGGVAPTSADTVTIASGHTVTLDTTGLACSTLTVNGTLKGHRTANSDLTAQTTITVAVNAVMDFGAPGDEITANCTLTLNNAKAAWLQGALTQNQQATSDSCNWSFYGDPSRVRLTTLASTASSGQPVVVLATASHGWQAGDRIVIEDTTNTTSNAFTYGTVASTSGANITLSANLTVAHAAGAKIGNLTSNLKIQSNNTGAANTGAGIFINMGNSGTTGGTHVAKFRDVEFYNLGESGVARAPIQVYTNVAPAPIEAVFDQCAFDNRNYIYPQTQMPVDFTDCVYYASLSPAVANVWRQGTIRASGGLYAGVAQIFSGGSFSNTFDGCSFSISNTGVVVLDQGVATNCTFSGNITAIANANETVEYKSCNLAGRFSEGIFRSQGFRRGFRCQITDCLLSTGAETAVASESSVPFWIEGSFVRYTNKDQDPTQQEWWSPLGVTKRNNSETKRSTSSISIKPLQTTEAETKAQQISCASGSTIRVIGYVKMDTSFYNGGTYTAPTVSLSGLGATPVTFTASAAANNAWEQFDLSITNSSGADGNFTLTYSARAQAVTTGTVYFDGVPDSPWVTKCRHYGFRLPDESLPTRVVDVYVSASESTAAGYTGVTINGATKRISFGVGTADSAQKFYDYSRAWACLNLDKDIPFTRAGVLYSLADGWTVVDPTFTNVTWGGGVIEWNTPGSITGSFDSTTFRFNTAGTYNLTGGTFAGEIHLTNTSGGGVIVIVLPSGIDYINDDPGTITVEVAVESATASITNIVPGSRLQVYNVTEDVEMVNTIVAGTSWSDSYPNGTGYSTGDVVRVRLAWMDGVEAKLPVQYQTVAASGGWSILADQVDDTVYNYNAIDGDSCTEFSHDFANVQVDVNDADNSTTVQRGYAWFIAGQMTADGIRYFFGGITAEDSVNYRINAALVNLRIQNIKAGSNLTVTGGNIYRTDDTDIFAPGASGSTASMRYGRAYTVRVGGGTGLSPEESAKLMSLPSAATVATAVDASAVLAKEATVASRLAAAAYVAPANADIATIKTEVQSKLDAAVSTRLATSNYVAPDDTAVLSAVSVVGADVAAVATAVANVDSDVAAVATAVANVDSDVAAVATAVANIDSDVAAVATAVSGLPAQVAAVPDATVTALQAVTLEVDMVKVRGAALDGTGTDADPWGPA